MVANGTLYLRRRYLDVEIIATKCSEGEMGEKVRDVVLRGNFVPNGTTAI